MALARHVHCVVLPDDGEQEAAADEIGLQEEYWCWFVGVVFW